jgi:hypothetical protein
LGEVRTNAANPIDYFTTLRSTNERSVLNPSACRASLSGHLPHITSLRPSGASQGVSRDQDGLARSNLPCSRFDGRGQPPHVPGKQIRVTRGGASQTARGRKDRTSEDTVGPLMPKRHERPAHADRRRKRRQEGSLERGIKPSFKNRTLPVRKVPRENSFFQSLDVLRTEGRKSSRACVSLYFGYV